MTYTSMIEIISQRLFESSDFNNVTEKLAAVSDITVAVPLSARPLLLAATFAHNPQSMLVLTSGEAAADLLARELRIYLGSEQVLRFPLYTHQPWRDQALGVEHIAQVGQRSRALLALTKAEAKMVVASVESLLRRIPAVKNAEHLITIIPSVAANTSSADTTNMDSASDANNVNLANTSCANNASNTTSKPTQLNSTSNPKNSLGYNDALQKLVEFGYDRNDSAAAPGQFSLKGDVLDIWLSTSTHPIRLEFFGDEIESIKRLVPGTAQSIGQLTQLEIYPATTQRLTEKTSAEAIRRIYGLKTDQLDALPLSYLQHIEAIRTCQQIPELELYLKYLADKVVSPLDCLHKQTMIVAIEPRSLFDASTRYHDAQHESINRHVISNTRAKAILGDLFITPAELDFSQQQLMTIMGMISGSGGLDLRLEVKYPTIRSSEERVALAAKNLLGSDYLTIVGAPSRSTKQAIQLALLDEHVSFDDIENLPHSPLSFSPSQIAYLADFDFPTAMTIPAAKLGLLGLNDNSASSVARKVRTSQGEIRGGEAAEGSGLLHKNYSDPTALSFSFKPGDYVVHEVHGIALFKAIVRQEVAGIERDYLHLEYAQGDKLLTPVDQISRVTRYVGPNSSAPRLTRLSTSDWSRATAKARGAARRLAFDLVELYARRASVQGTAFLPDNEMQQLMEEAFPYVETDDQLAAIDDVKADMQSAKPMDRLICGDVGFGKTEVALRAAFKAIQSGRQVLLLAPTTILAQQHFTTFFERFDPFAVRVEMLSRFRTAAQQKETLARLAEGKVDLLIGTHRLLSADVNPRNLGLVIIDEEQRFGVQHKEQLKNMREQVDVLTLSATPIPRTLQMALSGVRDMSLINTAPVSRNPVKVQVGEWNEDTVSAAIRHEIGRGGQVYYVSNRVRTIDDAEARVFAAAPEATVEIAHGQLTSRQLEQVMERFAAGQFDVLVATTIIESGLDNPRTNTLIIEDSQRLGLAQLYQLKGRVGRSHTQAYAYFLYPAENQLTVEAMERLMAIDEFQDLGSGLRIAMRDLEIRGAGTLLGAEQSGNIAAVGFDFFISMIDEAVRAARAGELAEGLEVAEAGRELDAGKLLPEIKVELPEPCFFPEEYMAAADERVANYRRLAATIDLGTLETLQAKLVDEYGAMPAAALNLFDRQRAKLMAAELDVTSIYLQRQAFVFEGLRLDSSGVSSTKQLGALYFATSYRLQWPLAKLPESESEGSEVRESTESAAEAEGAEPQEPKRLYASLVNLLQKLDELLPVVVDPDDVV